MTKRRPFKYICHLEVIFKHKEDRAHGTGFLVRNTQGKLILTAGHNLHDKEEEMAVKKMAKKVAKNEFDLYILRRTLKFHERVVADVVADEAAKKAAKAMKKAMTEFFANPWQKKHRINVKLAVNGFLLWQFTSANQRPTNQRPCG